MEQQYKTKYKVCVLGDTFCGKRAFVERLFHNHYLESRIPQLSPESQILKRDHHTRQFKWEFIVCPSQERLRELSVANLKNVDAVVLCCDRSQLTVPEEEWVKEQLAFIRQYTSSTIFLVYTKSDLYKEQSEGRVNSELICLGATSAKYGTGFEEILDRIYNVLCSTGTIAYTPDIPEYMPLMIQKKQSWLSIAYSYLCPCFHPK